MTITWDNWCDPVVEGQAARPAERAPHHAARTAAASLDADYNAVPDCIDPAQPDADRRLVVPGGRSSGAGTRNSTWHFLGASTARPEDPRPPRRDHSATAWSLTRTSHRTTAPVRHAAPRTSQQLARAGKPEVYDLNCPAAHPIAPGKQLAFSMQLRVPEKALLGAERPLLGARPVQRPGAAGARARPDRRLNGEPGGATRLFAMRPASVLTSIGAPKSLVSAKRRLVAGLRLFAAGCGRAQISVEHDDIATAAQQLVDRPTLAKVITAPQTIDRACGASRLPRTEGIEESARRKRADGLSRSAYAEREEIR